MGWNSFLAINPALKQKAKELRIALRGFKTPPWPSPPPEAGRFIKGEGWVGFEFVL